MRKFGHPDNPGEGGGSGSGGGRLDLTNVTVVEPTPAPSQSFFQELSHTTAGFSLGMVVFFIIFIFIVLLFILLWIFPPDAIQIIRQQELGNAELYEAIAKEKMAYREFVINLIENVLLNFLLPITTAILGYTFGRETITQQKE